MNKYRIGTDVPFQLSVDDGVEYLDLSNCTILNVAMYCDAQEAFAGSCTWQLNADDHTRLDCVYPGNRQVYTGIMRAVVVMEGADGGKKAYDLADIFEIVATTEESNATEDTVTSAVLSAWQLPMSTLSTIVEAAINATEAASGSTIAEISYTASTEDDGINVLHIKQADGTAHNFNLKNGSKGSQGIQGPQGEQGPQGPQGLQGNPGSSQDYPFELVNNVTTDDATKGLSAAMGVQLKSEITGLGIKLNNNNFVPLDFSPEWNEGYRNGINYSISSSSSWKYTNPYFITKGTLVFLENVHSSSNVANLCEVSSAGIVIRTIAGLNNLVSVSFVAERDMYIEISRTLRDYDEQIIKLYKFTCDDYSQFEENYKTIGLFDRNVFELGNLTMSTSNPPIFGASNSRIRTKTPIRLYPGDIIQLPADTQGFLSWFNYNEGWKTSGWTQGNVAINEMADYYLLIRYSPEVDIDNVSSIVNSIVIFHDNGKQDQLKDGITIRTINGASILGPGNISILRNDFMRRPIRSIAHRGCHILLNPTRNIPEGSKQAFIQAAKQGFDTIEFDIQYTSDGVPVVFHDDTINNVAMNPDGTEISEQIEVTASTYAELMEYDYGIRYGESYAGTKLLTLQEAVSIAKGLGLDIMPEIKRGFNGNRLREVIDIVSSFAMLDNCIWQALATSAGKVNIDVMLDYNERINVLYLVSGQDVSSTNIQIALSAVRDSNRVYIGASYTLLTQAGITLCNNAGIGLILWTVDSPSYIINDMDSYVCGVISDHTAAQKLLKENLISQAIE